MAKRGRKRRFSESAQNNTQSQGLSSQSQRKTGSQSRFQLHIESPSELNDRCLTCGSGEQLGHPGRETTKKPRAVDTFEEGTKFVQACAGGVLSLLLTDDGRVFSCGANEKGAVPVRGLDAGDITDRFTEIEFKPEIRQHGKIVQLTAGASFAAALTEFGSVIAWGNLRDPQGDFTAHSQFSQMQTEPVVVLKHNKIKILKIAAGENHLVMLSNIGQVLTVGEGSQGQLGRSRRFSSSRTSYLADDTGRNLVIHILERNKSLRFVDIFAGGNWTVLKTENGRLFACGLNNYAQLGIPLPPEEFQMETANGATQSSEKKDEGKYNVLTPVHIQAFDTDSNWTHVSGTTHLLLRNERGEVYAIGRNIDNALGIGTWTGRDDADHWRYDTLQRVKFPNDAKIAGVTASQACSIAWTEDGQAYAFGFDTTGQLGLGLRDGEDDKMVPTPRLIQSLHLNDYKITQVQLADQHAIFLAKSA